MKRLVLLLLAAATLAVPAVGWSGDDDDARGARTWRVTITNLTPAGSQPLSPPLFAVHSSRADVWSVGDIATHPVAAIAEDANNAPAESALDELPGVSDVFTGAGGPIPPGASRTYMVATRGQFNRLSVVTMLVNTNDAFTGLDSLRLHGHGTTVTTNAYDAGSEANNEDADFIPGPCCNNPFVRDPEGALIRMHGGITGVGDLDPDIYGWTGAVARFRIERG
jgi:Spondin_N